MTFILATPHEAPKHFGIYRCGEASRRILVNHGLPSTRVPMRLLEVTPGNLGRIVQNIRIDGPWIDAFARGNIRTEIRWLEDKTGHCTP